MLGWLAWLGLGLGLERDEEEEQGDHQSGHGRIVAAAAAPTRYDTAQDCVESVVSVMNLRHSVG